MFIIHICYHLTKAKIPFLCSFIACTVRIQAFKDFTLVLEKMSQPSFIIVIIHKSLCITFRCSCHCCYCASLVIKELRQTVLRCILQTMYRIRPIRKSNGVILYKSARHHQGVFLVGIVRYTLQLLEIGNAYIFFITRSNQTIQALADPASTPQTFGRPGHINPLYAQDNGVLRRCGHTEATIDLCRLAGLRPAGALMEIMNDDGTMARMPDLQKMAEEWGLRIITIKDLITYRLKKESIIEVGEEVDMPTEWGYFRLIPFRQQSNGLEHMALVKGEWSEDEPVLVRVHSSCATGDILGSKRCDCGQQLHKAMQMIEKEGKGVVVYMQQEGRGIGLMNKIEAYKLQEEGYDTVDANVHLGFKADERDYGCGAQMLRHLGIHKMRLLTNNPTKRVGLEAYGLEIVENVPIEVTPNKYNERYLKTKRDRMGHSLHLK